MEFTKTMFSSLSQEIKELRSENLEIKRTLQATQSELAQVKLSGSNTDSGHKVAPHEGASHASIVRLSDRLKGRTHWDFFHSIPQTFSLSPAYNFPPTVYFPKKEENRDIGKLISREKIVGGA